MFCVDEVLHALGELGLAADVAVAQELEHAEDAVLAARRRQAIDQPVAERDDRDAIEVREADVRQRGADLHRVVQLRQRVADRCNRKS